MEPKEILIRVITKFQDAGVESAKKVVAETATQINRAGKAASKSSIDFQYLSNRISLITISLNPCTSL